MSEREWTHVTGGQRRLPRLVSTSLVLALGLCQIAQTQTLASTSRVAVEVPPVIGRSAMIGHTNPAKVLHLSISLPYADPQGIQQFVDSVSDPHSPNYRQYLTPDQIGAQYGLPYSSVKAITDYLTSQGMKIRLVGKNRLSILVDSTVGQAEKAFGTTINDYHAFSPKEPGHQDYFSFSRPLSMPSAIAPDVIDITGLDSFTKPMPRALTPTQTRVLYNEAPIYNAGQRGEGRSLAISNFDGFRLSNVPTYYSTFGLPTPAGGVNSNVHVIAISGGAGSGTPQGEGDLDIQMVLGMAPLCDFTIYDGGASDLIGTLTREVNDNTADVISESYGWNLPTATANSAHNLHLSMSAQGITYMAASGDSGTTIEPFSYPNYEPEVLMVGGTIATVNGSGVRTSEVGWSGSGGGWSTKAVAFNTRPSWQAGTGVPTNINFRMSPDISLNASGNGTGAYQFVFNGSLTSGFVGTSFACPVFAGELGLAEQKIIGLGGLPANGAGKRRFGRIQDLIYGQNGRSDVWFDITSGNNGTLPNGSSSNATVAWDMVTGWGCMNIDAFVASQAGAGTPPAAPTNLVATGGNAQVSLTWSASSGATSYNVKRSTTSGGPYTTVGSPTTTSFTNTGLTNGTTYFYVVTAVNGAGESGNSNQASATPNVSIPNPPTNLVASSGNALVSLTWTASSGANSYNVKRSTTSGGPYTTVGSPTATSFTDGGLTNGTTYFYVVTAVNGAGESGNSNQASATPSAGSTQLLLNPGFESGAVSWTATAGVITSSTSRPAHGGSWKAWLDGYGTTHTDSVYQQVAIPSNVTTATLTFWVRIDTAETTTTTQFDKLQVQIRNSSNTVLSTLATYSNLDKNANYVQKSFNVSAFKGQTIRVYMLGTEDSSLQTSFVCDDFALNVQ